LSLQASINAQRNSLIPNPKNDVFALAVMFILGIVDFDDQYWSFRYFLPERLVRFMVNKLDLIGN